MSSRIGSQRSPSILSDLWSQADAPTLVDEIQNVKADGANDVRDRSHRALEYRGTGPSSSYGGPQLQSIEPKESRSKAHNGLGHPTTRLSPPPEAFETAPTTIASDTVSSVGQGCAPCRASASQRKANEELFKACRHNDLAKVRSLLSGHKSRAVVYAESESGKSALHYCAEYDSHNCAEWLLRSGGAPPDCPRHLSRVHFHHGWWLCSRFVAGNRDTPLYLSIAKHKEITKTTRLLVSWGCRLEVAMFCAINNADFESAVKIIAYSKQLLPYALDWRRPRLEVYDPHDPHSAQCLLTILDLSVLRKVPTAFIQILLDDIVGWDNIYKSYLLMGAFLCCLGVAGDLELAKMFISDKSGIFRGLFTRWQYDWMQYELTRRGHWGWDKEPYKELKAMLRRLEHHLLGEV